MGWNESLLSAVARISGISGTIRNIPYFNKQRVASVGATNSEYLSLMGLSYIAEIDITLASDQSIYYHFTAPLDRDVQILTRELSPDIAGCEYNLYLSASGLSDGSAIPVSRTNPLTGVLPTSTIKLLTAAPTAPGTYTTPIFIGKGGANNANSRVGGTESGKFGLTTYARGTGFVARIHNTSGASNRVVFRLEFAEMNSNLLNGIFQ